MSQATAVTPVDPKTTTTTTVVPSIVSSTTTITPASTAVTTGLVSTATVTTPSTTNTTTVSTGSMLTSVGMAKAFDMTQVTHHWAQAPTVRGASPFDDTKAEAAAVKFRRGIQGGLQDGDAVNDFVAVLGDHTNEQRRKIASIHKQQFGKSMYDELSSELRSEARDLALAMIAEPGYNDARCVKEAISGSFPIFTSAGTNEDTLIEIMATRTNEEIAHMKKAYTNMYGKDIEQDVKDDTSGKFQYFMVALLNGQREEIGAMDEPMADTINADAKELYNATKGRYNGADAFTSFNRILCLRSFYHLREVSSAYQRTYGVDFESVLNYETAEHLRDGYKAIIKYAQTPDSYFEERLFQSIIDQDEKAFMRILLSRSEKDLEKILGLLKEKRGKNFTDIISQRRSASYRQTLRALCGLPSENQVK